MKRTPLNRKTPLKRKTGLKRNTRLKPMSKKRQAQMPTYRELVDKLRKLCGNRSELDGSKANSLSGYLVDPHHISGRENEKLLDPFNIIFLTRYQHDIEQGNVKGMKPHSKEYLRALVYPIRIRQGFKPNTESKPMRSGR